LAAVASGERWRWLQWHTGSLRRLIPNDLHVFFTKRHRDDFAADRFHSHLVPLRARIIGFDDARAAVDIRRWKLHNPNFAASRNLPVPDI